MNNQLRLGTDRKSESQPQMTIITLSTGEKFMVVESPHYVVSLVNETEKRLIKFMRWLPGGLYLVSIAPSAVVKVEANR